MGNKFQDNNINNQQQELIERWSGKDTSGGSDQEHEVHCQGFEDAHKRMQEAILRLNGNRVDHGHIPIVSRAGTTQANVPGGDPNRPQNSGLLKGSGKGMMGKKKK